MYPAAPRFASFNPASSRVPVESLGQLLDKLTMSEQPSTSRNVSFDATSEESSAATPSMFSGTPESQLYGASFVLVCYQSLARTHSGIASTSWSTPIYSSRIPSGFSHMETQQFDPAY